MGKGVRCRIAVLRRIVGRSDTEAINHKQNDPLDHGRTITDGDGEKNSFEM
jgi:hypothetical protein